MLFWILHALAAMLITFRSGIALMIIKAVTSKAENTAPKF